MNNRILIKLLILGIIIASIIIIVSLLSFEKELKEYPLLKKDDILNDIIINVHKYQGVAYIETVKNSKYRINYSVNYLYTPIYLHDFIQEKDSIFKQENNDTVYLYRNGKEYHFVLGKIINKK